MAKNKSKDAKPRNIQLVMQQGGTHDEWYVHPYNSVKQANKKRKGDYCYMKQNNPFTVIGFYEESGRKWTQHVEAKDDCAAVIRAVKALEKSGGHTDRRIRQNIAIVAVFAGHITEVSETETISYAIDWPGLEL